MKKNFLLFALMLFLPVLVFAQQTVSVTVAENQDYNGNASKEVTYDGKAISLTVQEGMGPNIHTYDLRTESGDLTTGQYRISKGGNAFNANALVSAIKDAGTYFIQAYRTGRANHTYYGRVIVKPYEITSDDFADLDDCAYNGELYQPVPATAEGSLAAGADFGYWYRNVGDNGYEPGSELTADAGDKTVVIYLTDDEANDNFTIGTGKSWTPNETDEDYVEYEGETVVLGYAVTPATGEYSVTLDPAGPVTYNEKDQTPEISVALGELNLIAPGAEVTPDFQIQWYKVIPSDTKAPVEQLDPVNDGLINAGIYKAKIIFDGNKADDTTGNFTDPEEEVSEEGDTWTEKVALWSPDFIIEKAPVNDDAEIIASDVYYNGETTRADAIKNATLVGASWSDIPASNITFVSVEDDGQGEVSYPNHVGDWKIIVTFAPEDEDNYEASVIEDEFKVKQASMAMNLGVVNWVYGKEYPAVIEQYYSIAVSEYRAGDSQNNVRIENTGKVQPYQSIGEGFLPVGTGYKWNLQPGVEPKAVTTIEGVDYENYYIVVHNDNAILNIGKANISISLDEIDLGKVYGFKDPTFNAGVNNDNNSYVTFYTKEGDEVIATNAEGASVFDEEGKIIVPEDDDPAFAGMDDDEIAEAQAAYADAVQGELDAMATIFGGVTITREEGEDVGDYKFTLTATDAVKAFYNIENEKNFGYYFTITPYDLAETYKADGTVWVDGVDKASDKIASKFVVTADDIEYEGEEVTHVGAPAEEGKPIEGKTISVKFAHDVLGSLTLTNKATATKPADYAIGAYDRNFNVKRNPTTWKVEADAVVTIVAHMDDNDLNENIINTQDQKFAITPALVTIGFGEYQKVYNTSDAQAWEKGDETHAPKGILNPRYEGFKNEADENAAITDASHFFNTVPVFEREAGESVGTYKIKCEKQTVEGIAYKVVGTALNYDFESTEGSLEIIYGGLTIIAQNDGKIYGEDDPDFFEYTVEGWDEATPFDYTQVFFKRDKAGTPEGEKVGEYDIVKNTSVTKIGNYEVTYVGAKFNIVPAEGMLKIIADDKSKTYGQKDPALTYHAEIVTGYDEETDEPIYGPYELAKEYADIIDARITRDEGEDATRRDATTDTRIKSPYDIYFDDTQYEEEEGGLADLPELIEGYIPEYVNGDFDINKANLHVKYVDETIKYGTEPKYDIELQKDNSGKTDLKNNDKWENVKPEVLATGVTFSGYPIYDEEGNIVKDGPGTYTITVEGGEIQNYIVHYVEGTLTVTASGLQIWAVNQTADYPEPVEKTYSTPAANLKPVKGLTIGVLDAEGVLPADFDFSELVELSCTATKVGTNKKAITIKLKDGIENYDVTLENPAEGTDNGAADFIVNPLSEIHLAYANVAQALEDHKGIEMEKVYLPNRQLKADQWYTFVLPFEFEVPELSYKLYYGVVDVLNEEANDGDFHFDLTINGVEANQPFLLKVAENPANPAEDQDGYAVTREQMEEIFFEGKTIADVEEDGVFFAYNDLANSPVRADKSGNSITGQYTGVAKGELTDLDRIMSNGIFGKASATATLKPTVAYISYPDAEAAANGRIFVQEADGTITAIESVETEVAEGEGWYTITGIKLDAKPTVKGTYIYNGKKVSIQ